MSANLSSVDIAVDALQRCGVVAYPTEAVWGLGCDPFDYSAVQKILALKNRPEHKGLILVAADITQITQLLAPLSKSQINKLISSWPGPTTWVIEDINNIYPSWIKGQHSSVAIRVSSHSTIKALCNAFGGVLVSTSLNPSGMPSAVSESQSRAYFGDEVSYFVEGDVDKNSQPSKIIILNSGKLLR